MKWYNGGNVNALFACLGAVAAAFDYCRQEWFWMAVMLVCTFINAGAARMGWEAEQAEQNKEKEQV